MHHELRALLMYQGCAPFGVSFPHSFHRGSIEHRKQVSNGCSSTESEVLEQGVRVPVEGAVQPCDGRREKECGLEVPDLGLSSAFRKSLQQCAGQAP